MFFNEIYPTIFEKSKPVRAHERSTIQLMSVLNSNVERDIINNFKWSSKIHRTLDDKKCIPLHFEHLHFLINIAGWLVTNIYKDYTFEKAKFKQDFVFMNRKALQKATSPVERNFYKLLNNANFGIDCRNNIDKYQLKPI